MDTLGQLLEIRYQGAFIDEVNRHLLFNNVYWHKPYLDASGPIVYQHQCGSKGGRYRISKRGTCYKCKKMIGSHKQLDTIKGLKALTSTDRYDDFINIDDSTTMHKAGWILYLPQI